MPEKLKLSLLSLIKAKANRTDGDAKSTMQSLYGFISTGSTLTPNLSRSALTHLTFELLDTFHQENTKPAIYVPIIKYLVGIYFQLDSLYPRQT